MQQRRHRTLSITVRRTLAVLALGALAAILVAGAAACGGGTSVVGDYKYDSGSESGMTEFALTLNDDDSFKLSGPNPAGGDDVSVTGTYTLDGDKIVLKAAEGGDSESGKVDGDKLVFETVTWVKK